MARGDAKALDELVEQTYDELRRRASAAFRREGSGHTLQPTALVHEVYLRVRAQRRPPLERRLFQALAARLELCRSERRRRPGRPSAQVGVAISALPVG